MDNSKTVIVYKIIRQKSLRGGILLALPLLYTGD